MPIPGRSIYGFLSEQDAINYRRANCIVPPAVDDAALAAEWAAARALLGPAVASAGQPAVSDIAAAHAPHIAQVMLNPRFPIVTENVTFSFKMVELKPLLAFQHHVINERVDEVTTALGASPTVDALLPLFLPPALELPQFYWNIKEQSVTITSKSLNLRVLRRGYFGPDAIEQKHFAGPAFGVANPLVTVSAVNGRYYLTNGYHRAVAAVAAGVLEAPCLLIETGEYLRAVGLGGMPQDILESANPPTLGHFTENHATDVQLRRMTRAITISWSEDLIQEMD